MTETIAAIAVFILALAGVWLGGQRSRRQSERAKQDRRDLDAMKDAKDVRNEIDRESPDDMRRRLDGWMRDDD